MNLYTYVGNNPINDVDPMGLVGAGLHHGYPLYLGGSVSQPVWDFTKNPKAHAIAQKYISDRFPYGNAGRAAWKKLSQAEQRAIIAKSLRAAGISSKAIAANMDAMMVGAKPGVKIPRVGTYGKTIAVGTVLSACLIVLTMPSTAYAEEVRYDWRESKSCVKGKVECASFREVVQVESWYNLQSSIWEGVDPVKCVSSTRVSPWVDMGEMTAQEAAKFETPGGLIIEQKSVWGYTIYNIERVRCRFNGKDR